MQTIEEWTFGHCYSLWKVTFGENSQLKEIGDYMFFNTNITEVQIPEGV